VTVTCPNCGAVNRLSEPALAAGKAMRCGRCKTELPLAAEPLTITDANFSDLVERASVPVLLDMWAPWCGPCHMLAPTIDQVSREFAGIVRVGKLNIDENPAVTDRFGVRSIPTMLLLRNGREVDRLVGVQPKTEIVRRVERVAHGAGGGKA
jgi:thioredoxin 2